MAMIRAAFFDVDGVLLDTEVFQYLAWKEALDQVADYQLGEDEYMRLFCGHDSTHNATQVISRFHPAISLAELVTFRDSIAKILVESNQINMMPYVVDVLGFFASRVATALTTGSNQEECNIKLQRSGLDSIVRRYIIPIVSRDMVKNGKPAPDIYQEAAKLRGVHPSSAVSFEDSNVGIQSAESAGTTCFAVPNKWTALCMPKNRTVYANLREAQKAVEASYSLPSR